VWSFSCERNDQFIDCIGLKVKFIERRFYDEAIASLFSGKP
jgi:hypothetical protein